MISVRGVRKRFGEVTALDGVSAEMRGFVVLLGPNGAGKTTLLRCVLGLLEFDGAITVGGLDVAARGKAARRLMGYVPQRPALPPDLTCAETLDLFAGLHDRRRGDDAWLARVGLASMAGRPVRALSGGQRQRLALAVALQVEPAVVLFDEPAANLDAASRAALQQDLAALAGEGRTVVLSTHLVADALRSAARALVLDAGRVAFDGPASALALTQRIVFTLNGAGRPELLAVLRGYPAVRVAEAAGAVTASARPEATFDLLAAVTAAGVRPLAVRIEEPALDAVERA